MYYIAGNWHNINKINKYLEVSFAHRHKSISRYNKILKLNFTKRKKNGFCIISKISMDLWYLSMM